MRSPDELSEFLRANGLKATPQRHAVFEALHRESGHPTADDIWARVREQMPTISLRTVYQALHDLVDLGEARIVTVGAGAAQFDRNTEQHDHFVCRKCEAIFDVVSSRPRLMSGFPDVADVELPATDGSGPSGARSDVVEPAANFQIETAEVIFRGLCAPCGG